MLMLLLFDVDGTLITEGDDCHLAAVLSAIEAVYRIAVPAADAVLPDSKTDLQIAREIIAARGCPPDLFWAGAGEFCAAAAAEYARTCPDLSGRVLDGIPGLLADLATRPGVRLGLLSGGICKIALTKLAAAGLAGFFSPVTGAFGCESDDRAALPPAALARAGYGALRTLIIGDTPRDITCAHTSRIRCVAVATGGYGASALHAADRIARSTAELRAALNAELAR
jgi:phosphoglycolate phosphatase-like HAD superfamily hydrolase